ncbi:MAG: hypothetical protein U9Q82_14845 [Chloroflexota bacterium]|nr:hypothetical protein [Chloroflexota bacterium]
MNIGEILTRAWEIIWKHKVLWIFGILAGCGQGGGGGGGSYSYQSSGGSGSNRGSLPPEIQQLFFEAQRFFEQVELWQIIAIVAGVIFVILLIWLIMLALSTIGRMGLIQGTIQADGDADRLSFGELFSTVKPFFWRILGLNLLMGLAIFSLVTLFLIFGAIASVLTFGIGLFCLIPLICLLVPLSWLANVVIQQANTAVIVEDLNILDGIDRGWNVFRENMGDFIIMALILGIGGAILGFIIALPLILIIIPAAIGAAIGTATETSLAIGSSLIVGGLCFVGYVPVLILLSGVLQAYVQSAWTLTYLRLTESPLE